MSQNISQDVNVSETAVKVGSVRGCLTKIYKNAAMILVLIIAAVVLFSLARASIYKIRPYERGLHLRGGSFVGIDQPGWHFQIPFVDTVIGLNIVERPGVIDSLAAMTADDVTMDISLLYTYRVVDPVRYALEVTEPDQIVAGFVQGTLRDVVNTRKMDEVMHRRADFNQELMGALVKKQDRYGVEFILVQIQTASPPAEVVSAIKEKMVASQQQESAAAEAAKQRTLADSAFYATQKKAEGDAYQITTLAEADAQRIDLSAKAKADAVRMMLQELEGKGSLADAYIQVLIAQELSQNSKLIISSGGTMPVIDLRDATTAAQATPQTTPEGNPTATP
jgi:regulator of protease activity HflC (stomatin/prohibitin superfamily)